MGDVLSLRAAIVPDPAEAVERANGAFLSRQNFTNTWERQRQLFLPDAAPFNFTNQTQGQRDRETTVDTYGQYAARVHATFLFGATVNGDGDWMKFTASGGRAASDPAVLSWCRDYTHALTEIVMAPEVGFLEQYFAMLLERSVYGNGVMYAGDRPGRDPIARCAPLRDTAFEAGSGHEPDSFHWKQSLTAAEWQRKFPKRVLGEKVDLAANGVATRNNPYTFIHQVIENPGWAPLKLDQMPHERRYLSLWLNEGDKCLVAANWLTSSAYTAFRCPRRANENYGRGPADEALEEVQMTQRVRVGTIRGIESAVTPVMLLPDDGVVTPPTNEPAGAIVVQREMMRGAGDPIRYLKNEARPDIGQSFLRDSCYASIDRAFSRDLMTLPREPRMLDSQIVGLQEEQSRGVVPIISPLFAPLARFIARIADIAHRQNRLPAPPPEARGLKFHIEFRNPLERAARLAEVRAFMQALSMVANAVQIDPGARHSLKVVEGVQYCSRILGVPETLITDAKALKALLAADAQQAQQAQQEESAKNLTTAVKNAGAGLKGLATPPELRQAA